jgi:hypothetical protein
VAHVGPCATEIVKPMIGPDRGWGPPYFCAACERGAPQKNFYSAWETGAPQKDLPPIASFLLVYFRED